MLAESASLIIHSICYTYYSFPSGSVTLGSWCSGCSIGWACSPCTPSSRLGICAVSHPIYRGLALEALLPLFTVRFIPFFMILWIIGIYLLIFLLHMLIAILKQMSLYVSSPSIYNHEYTDMAMEPHFTMFHAP